MNIYCETVYTLLYDILNTTMSGCRRGCDLPRLEESCCCKVRSSDFKDLLSSLEGANDDFTVYLSGGNELEFSNLVDYSISGGWATATISEDDVTYTTLLSLCDVTAITTP